MLVPGCLRHHYTCIYTCICIWIYIYIYTHMLAPSQYPSSALTNLNMRNWWLLPVRSSLSGCSHLMGVAFPFLGVPPVSLYGYYITSLSLSLSLWWFTLSRRVSPLFWRFPLYGDTCSLSLSACFQSTWFSFSMSLEWFLLQAFMDIVSLSGKFPLSQGRQRLIPGQILTKGVQSLISCEIVSRGRQSLIPRPMLTKGRSVTSLSYPH